MKRQPAADEVHYSLMMILSQKYEKIKKGILINKPQPTLEEASEMSGYDSS